MRLLPLSLLCAIFSSSVIAQTQEQPLGVPKIPQLKDETPVEDDSPKATLFNGIEVPPLPEIDGEKFNSTIKDGFWFVKHYS